MTPQKGFDWKKDKNLKYRFGITLEQYTSMLEKQNNCCDICKRHKSKFKRSLAVDHCHKTGKIRGLLCSKCNGNIGKVYESIELLQNMIDYLKLYT